MILVKVGDYGDFGTNGWPYCLAPDDGNMHLKTARRSGMDEWGPW